MILPSDSDRVGGATFIILLKKKQNYKSTAWFMQQAADAGNSALLKVLGPPLRGGKTTNLAGRLTIWRLDRSKIDGR